MINDLAIVLPSHSLDDFPGHLRGKQATGLLAACTALWHPALLAAAGKLPSFVWADQPPEPAAGQLIVVPEISQAILPKEYVERAGALGSVIVEGKIMRQEIVAAALSALADGETAIRSAGSALPTADFFALGFCHLQMELLTRRMRYSSHLNENRFQQSALDAAAAWAANQPDTMREKLLDCHSALLESRGQFYPVDVHLLDVILVAPTTFGPLLRAELNSALPRNVLISGATLAEMEERDPETLAALRAGVEAGTVAIIGGEFTETELPLITYESILAQLCIGLPVYERLLGRRPVVFGRRRFGLTPALPQILRDCGFIGALHVVLDEGRAPQFDRAKTRWEGFDGAEIDALGRVPLDAGNDDSFLMLPDELSTTMDHDFVATQWFAHWPGHASPFFDDLRCAAATAAVLGKFETVDEYFRNTESPTVAEYYSADVYRTPYLRQFAATSPAVANEAPVDPIAASVAYTKRQELQTAESTLSLMTAVVQGVPATADVPAHDRTNRDDVWLTGAEEQALMPSIAGAVEKSLESFATALIGNRGQNESGYLFVNPLSFTREACVLLPARHKSNTKQFPAAISLESNLGKVADKRQTTIEVPPLGFAWMSAAEIENGTQQRSGSVSAQLDGNECVLASDRCEVKISLATGGIQSVRDFRNRGNRLSQQIAIRLPANAPSDKTQRTEDENTLYTSMVADGVTIDVNGPLLAQATSTGKLVAVDERQLARFSQIVSLWHASRMAELRIVLTEVAAEFSADPWNSYIACRFAWPDETAQLRRSVHGCSFATDAKRIEAPQFVEILSGDMRTAILTAGLPYHQRVGRRMLDSLLRVRGSQGDEFRFGIAVETPHAWRAASEFIAPPMAVEASSPPPTTSGWLFHVDAAHVVATHWSPREEAGRVIGFRVRLLEMAGRRGELKLRSCQAPMAAQRTDLAGTPHADLPIDGDAVQVSIKPYEWIQVAVSW